MTSVTFCASGPSGRSRGGSPLSLVLRLVLGLRLGREPGAGERGGAVAVVLHPHDPPVADGDDHAGLAVRLSPLRKPRAGHLHEHALVDGDDGVEAGDDALALALEERGEHLAAVVTVPLAALVPQPFHARVDDLGERGPVAAQERVEARPHELVVAGRHESSMPPVRRAIDAGAWSAVALQRARECVTDPSGHVARRRALGVERESDTVEVGDHRAQTRRAPRRARRGRTSRPARARRSAAAASPARPPTARLHVRRSRRLQHAAQVHVRFDGRRDQQQLVPVAAVQVAGYLDRRRPLVVIARAG